MRLCPSAAQALLAATALAAAAPSRAPASPSRPAAPPSDEAEVARGVRAVLEVPLFSETFGELPVATVEDEVITLREFTAALAATHEGRSEAGRASADAARAVLGRLVDARLIAIEARAMGLDELPEVQEELRAFEAARLRELAELNATRSVAPDAAEVERLFREVVRQWKIKSLLFRTEEDARRLRDAVDAGASFGALAAEALARGEAQGREQGEYYSGDKLLPQVLQAVSALAPGQVSGVVAIPAGALVLELQEIRYPEDAQARATAERIVRDAARRKALQAEYARLARKHARLDVRLLAALDFESPRPGFEALAKDRRVLARLAGEPPITVADLAAQLRRKFFHGVEAPIRDRKVNAAKAEVLESMLAPRVFRAEARALGLERDDRFLRAVAEFRLQALFGAFVERVVVPDLHVDDAEARRAYEERRAQLTTPPLYRLEAITFGSADAARAAQHQLAAGTDFGWLRAQAKGQVPLEQRALDVDGRTLVADALPPGLAASLAGARAGDARLHAGADGQHVLVRVAEVFPPRTRPYEEVRASIARDLAGEKIAAALADWVAKLRAAHRVRTFLVAVQSG